MSDNNDTGKALHTKIMHPFDLDSKQALQLLAKLCKTLGDYDFRFISPDVADLSFRATERRALNLQKLVSFARRHKFTYWGG